MLLRKPHQAWRGWGIRRSGHFQNIEAVNPEGGKEARGAAISPQVEDGNVYLPDGAPWLEEFLGEVEAFPRGSHDDEFDAMSQALLWLSDSHIDFASRFVVQLRENPRAIMGGTIQGAGVRMLGPYAPR